MPCGRKKKELSAREGTAGTRNPGKKNWKKKKQVAALLPEDKTLARVFETLQGPLSDIKKDLGPVCTMTHLASDKKGGLRLSLVFFDAADLPPPQKRCPSVTSTENVKVPLDYRVRGRPKEAENPSPSF